MRLKTYKTSHFLWFVFGFAYFLFWGSGLDFFSALFSGSLRFSDLASFDFICPLVLAIVLGWLFQCAVVIVWKRNRPNTRV
jgi:hypothetical protein